MNIAVKASVVNLVKETKQGAVGADVYYPRLVRLPDGSFEVVVFSLRTQNLLWFSVFGRESAGLGRKNPVAVCRAARRGAQLANGGASTRSCSEGPCD